MRKLLLLTLLFTLSIGLIAFATERPEMPVTKAGVNAKQLNDSYAPNKDFGIFEGIYSTKSRPATEAVYMNEGFEGTFPPADWTLANAGAGFIQTDIQAHSGTYSAYHNDDSGQQDDWVVTPAIDLTGSASARLNFWQYENWGDYYVLHQIYVTTDTTGIMGDTLSWTKLYEGAGVEDTWEHVIVDLSAYDGQTIYLGFYYSGDYADEWYIDDVVVEDAPVVPIMSTLLSELVAPPTMIGSSVSDSFGVVANTGGSALTISSIVSTNSDFTLSPSSGTVNPGDTLFIEGTFTPSSAGLITGQMIITGDDPVNPADTIQLSGVGYTSDYVMEDFEEFPYESYNFTRINNNGDAYQWGWFGLISAGDTNMVAGIRYATSGNDDYLVTPPIPVTSGDFISFDSWAYSAGYPETWQVLVSTTDKQASSFTIGLDTVTSNITSPVRYTYDLSAYDGQTIYVAIRNVSVDQYYQWVDNMIMPMPAYPTFINEIYYDSPGGDTGTFTEIFGKPGMDLSGYVLQGINGNGGASYTTIDLTGNTIPADGYFVVAQDATVLNADLIDSGVDWQNGPDNVILVHGSDTLDAIGYGNFSSAVFTGEGNPVPEPYVDYGLGRYPDGFDTNDNAADFYPNYLTPGELNYQPSGIIGGGSSLAFDTTEVGMQDTMSFTIYNNGGSGLTVDSIVTSNPAFVAEWPDGAADSTIAFGASASINVIFAPTAALTYDDSMTIYTNDLLNGARSVALSGTGKLVGQLATVILAAQIGGDSQYRSFWVNGSWDSSGVYDPNWTGPMVELKDNGVSPDVTAGDGIFAGSVILTIDNAVTYSWWTGSENDVNSFLDDGVGFSVTDMGTVYPDTVVVDGDGGINQWVISLAGSFNGWNNSSDDMNRNGTEWSIIVPLNAGTVTYKYTVMHQWNAAYGDGGVGGAGSDFSFTVPTDGDYLFTFDDSDNSQSVVPYVEPPFFFDDFEDYTAGTQLVVQNPTDWSTWSGGGGTSEDPYVSSAHAFSGSNSVVIVQNNDLIKPFGTQTFGRWTVEFMVYVPTGKAGYFNFMSDFYGTNQVWALDAYFDVGGGGRLVTEQGVETAFSYTYDTWQQCKLYVDLDTDYAEFWFDSTMVHSWQWTNGSTGVGPLQLDVADLYGATADDEMYVDDFTVIADTLQFARVQVIHNAADPAADSVDVYVNGELAIPDFKFRTATPYLDLPAETPLAIGIAPGNSSSVDDTLKNFNVTLAANGTYVVIANGVVDPNNFAPNPEGIDIGLTLFIKPDAREAGTSNYVDIFGVHGVTDAPYVDIRITGGGAGTVLDNVKYGDVSDYLGLIPINYTMEVTDSSQSTVLYTIPDVNLAGLSGESAVLLASGFVDPSANQNGESFALMAVLADGSTSVFEPLTGIQNGSNAIPTEFALEQNYPNPFNPTTTIKYALKENADVVLKIYNLLGQEVRTLVNTRQEPGYKTVLWNGLNNAGSPVASGIYIYRIQANDFVKSHKMILMK